FVGLGPNEVDRSPGAKDLGQRITGAKPLTELHPKDDQGSARNQSEAGGAGDDRPTSNSSTAHCVERVDAHAGKQRRSVTRPSAEKKGGEQSERDGPAELFAASQPGR